MSLHTVAGRTGLPDGNPVAKPNDTRTSTHRTWGKPMNNSIKTIVNSILISAVGLMSPLALAQEQAAEKPAKKQDVIEEVVVTATRVETNIMTTSIAVSAFDQDTLTTNGVRDIRDAASLVPNFDVAFSPSDSGVQLTLRGINSNNFTEISDPSVAFHVDGVYSPRPQGAVALMYDLERLEVMRGPQGTLFGRNSAAGSVNVVTAKPTTEGIYSTFGLEVGNRQQRSILGTVNLPITDTFAIRANFFGEKRDGFADQAPGTSDRNGVGYGGPDGIPDMDQRWNHPVSADEFYGNADRWAARISGLWDATDDLSWRVTLETAQDNAAGWPIAPNCERNPAVCQYNGGGIDYVDPNIPGYLDMSMDAMRSHVNYALTEDIDLVYNLGYARQQRRQQWDGDMGWRPVPGPNTGWLNRYSPWPSLYLATDSSDYKSWSNELQLIGETGRFNWIVGVFDFREDNQIIFDVEQPFCCSLGALGGISFIQPERTLESQAIFGQATWHYTDQLHFTVGMRYTEDTRTDKGGRNYGCYGGANCSWSAGQIEADGWPTEDQRDELLLPLFTSADLTYGMGSQDRLGNYELFDTNDNSEKFDAFNWRLGVDYDLDEERFLYAYAATGSKAGSFGDGVDVCRCGRIEFFSFKPEEVLNYEVGYKATMLEGRLNFAVAAFYTDFRDKQVSQFRTVGYAEDADGNRIEPPQEIGTLVTSNAGSANIMGLEVEWTYIPWDNGKVSGSLGLLDAEFNSWPGYAGEAYFCDERADLGAQYACIPADDGSGTSDIEGNKLPYSTPVSFTVMYEHNFYMNDGARLTPWVKFHYEGEMHFTEGNFDAVESLSDKRDPFGMVDATLRYTNAKDTWSLEAYVYNITDERIPTYWSDWPGSGAPMYAWNAPRSVGMRFTYNIHP
jgi:iron complex outermembrane receptor protein